MEKFALLDRVILKKAYPDQKIPAGTEGQITQINRETDQHWVQINPDSVPGIWAWEVDPALIEVTVDEIEHIPTYRPLFSAQPVYCRQCGKRFMTDFRQWSGMYCNQDCCDKMKQKQVLSMMGRPAEEAL